MLPIIIAVVIALVIAVPVTFVASTTYHKNIDAKKVGSADEKARQIIDEALKTAETKKRESMLEIKEESIRAKNELDKEIKKITDKLNLREQRLNDLEEEITDLRMQLKRAIAEKEHIVGIGNKDKKVDHKYEDSENEVEIKEVDINDIFDLLFGGTVVHSPEDEGDEHNCEECPSKHMCSNRK